MMWEGSLGETARSLQAQVAAIEQQQQLQQLLQGHESFTQHAHPAHVDEQGRDHAGGAPQDPGLPAAVSSAAALQATPGLTQQEYDDAMMQQLQLLAAAVGPTGHVQLQLPGGEQVSAGGSAAQQPVGLAAQLPHAPALQQAQLFVATSEAGGVAGSAPVAAESADGGANAAAGQGSAIKSEPAWQEQAAALARAARPGQEGRARGEGEPGDSDVADILLAMADSSGAAAAVAAANQQQQQQQQQQLLLQQLVAGAVMPAAASAAVLDEAAGEAGAEAEAGRPGKRARTGDAPAEEELAGGAGAAEAPGGGAGGADAGGALGTSDAGAAELAASGGAELSVSAPEGLLAQLPPGGMLVDANAALHMQQLEQQLQALQQAQMLQLLAPTQLGGLQLTQEQLQQLQLQMLLQQQLQLQQAQLLQLHVAGLPPGATAAVIGAPGVSSGGAAGGGSKDRLDGDSSQHLIRRHGCLPERLITRDMLKGVFHLPIEEAAKSLGIGQTMLKHYCRKFGIPRWPYRKRQSVVILMDSIKKFATERPLNIEPALAKLNQFLDLIDEDPNVDLDAPIKRLRQAFFKEAYKKRVREQQGENGPDGGHSMRASRNAQRTEVWLENLCNAICEEHAGPRIVGGAGGGSGGGGDEGDDDGDDMMGGGSGGGTDGGAGSAAAAAASSGLSAGGVMGGGGGVQVGMEGMEGSVVGGGQGIVVVSGSLEEQQQQLLQLQQLQQLQQVAVITPAVLQQAQMQAALQQAQALQAAHMQAALQQAQAHPHSLDQALQAQALEQVLGQVHGLEAVAAGGGGAGQAVGEQLPPPAQ